jgi:hypothetical protein
MRKWQSFPTEPKRYSSLKCHETSSTAPRPLKTEWKCIILQERLYQGRPSKSETKPYLMCDCLKEILSKCSVYIPQAYCASFELLSV